MKSAPTSQTLCQIVHKDRRVMLRALSNVEGGDQLRIGVNRDKGPLVAHLRAVIRRLQEALMLADVAPNLVNLNALARQIAHLLVHDPLATSAYFDRKAHDCVTVRFGHPLQFNIELPSTRQLMIWARRASGVRLTMANLVLAFVYLIIYIVPRIARGNRDELS